MRKRITDYDKTLPIVEVYRCIQSEGSRIGRPTIAVRTTGCTHRCYFGEGGWCDSWYTSIHPEKGQFSFNDIVKIYDENPQVKEMMLTGGSPTMHPALVNELTHFAYERDIIITIETEGSAFVETDYPIGIGALESDGRRLPSNLPYRNVYVSHIKCTRMGESDLAMMMPSCGR